MKKSKIFLMGLGLFPIVGLGQTSLTAFCPPISALTKDPLKQTWSAPKGFKSYDLSFVTKITKFLGAQWRGAAVGQITCVYKGLPKNSFNVLLSYNTLAYEPVGANWGKNLGGYRNCIARELESCPFNLVPKKKNDNIYQDLEKLKS